MLNQVCNNCGERENPLSATFCMSCGSSLFAIKANEIIGSDDGHLSLRQLIGFAGSAILFIGVFTPIINIPVVGSMNYFQNGRGDGVFILLLAVFSCVLSWGRKFRFLLFTGGGSLVILGLTYAAFQYRMSQAQSDLKQNLSGNPFAGIGEAMINSVQISWGWAVLIVGALLLICSALVNDSTLENGRSSLSGVKFAAISNRALYSILGIIFVCWLGFLSYGYITPFLSGLFTATNTPMQKNSSVVTPATNSGYTKEELQIPPNKTENELQSVATPAANASSRPRRTSDSNKELGTGPAGIKTASVITENANFRLTPDSFGVILDTVPYDAEVKVIKQKGPWFEVDYNGTTGWMHGNTLRLANVEQQY